MMIEINLLPGAKKTVKGGSPKINLGGAIKGLAEKVKDPFMIGAVGSVVAAVATVGILFSAQQARATEVEAKLEVAVRDSTRLTSVLAAKRKVTAERDSVQRQLQIIRTIDDNRYNWAHILDEVSQALPQYTWLTVLEQTTAEPLPPGADTTGGRDQGPARPKADSGTSRAAKLAAAKADPVTIHPPLAFRLVGQTVDIQALTLFMKQLEGSPFLHKVSLKRSEIVVVDTKDITEFELLAEYEVPPSSVIRTAALVVPVR
ncbi:MAG: PilN domain-containing protein [Phycisphaerae bacterium]|nr:PilN domain-containing protein [Gemmatimonadaceae bacterium]